MNQWPMLSAPLESALARVISLGAGVQSVTMALMAARGDLGPMPDAAVFADTGGERAATYAYLDWLEAQLPYPIIRARRDGPTLSELSIAVASGERARSGASLPPWFTVAEDGTRGMMPKYCSGTFKRDVVVRVIRQLLGAGPGRRVVYRTPVAESWLGISKDEIWRVQTRVRQTYLVNRHPLIEADMSRQDCLRWLAERQYPAPPKSSCVFCPFRTNEQWRDLRDNAPGDFAEAARVDSLIRGGSSGHDGLAYVHRQCVPLGEADLSDEHPDQLGFDFAADCDSCGI